jgi:hypothetical protein
MVVFLISSGLAVAATIVIDHTWASANEPRVSVAIDQRWIDVTVVDVDGHMQGHLACLPKPGVVRTSQKMEVRVTEMPTLLTDVCEDSHMWSY